MLSNDELGRIFNLPNDWIFSRTGIRERRILAPGQDTSDMALVASHAAIADAGIAADEITRILLASCAPDGLIPNTACTLERKLGLSGLVAMDFNVACSGFLYGLYLALAILLLEPQAKILLVTAEALSRICDAQSRNVRILFGDGAAAAVIGAGKGSGATIEDVLLSFDGTHGDFFATNGAGSRAAYVSPDDPVGAGYFLRMNGREVFKHAVCHMTEVCQSLLARNGLRPEDIDLFVPYQANLRIIEAVGQRLGIPTGNTHLYIEHCGNTSSASIPLAMKDAARQQQLRTGERILLASFGAGFTWGAALLRGWLVLSFARQPGVLFAAKYPLDLAAKVIVRNRHTWGENWEPNAPTETNRRSAELMSAQFKPRPQVPLNAELLREAALSKPVEDLGAWWHGCSIWHTAGFPRWRNGRNRSGVLVSNDDPVLLHLFMTKGDEDSAAVMVGQAVQGLGDEHRPWRDFAVLTSLEEAAKLSGLRVVAAKSRDTDVLQCFGDRQAMGFDEPHGGVVLPPFAVAPRLRLRRESVVDIRL